MVATVTEQRLGYQRRTPLSRL